MILETQFLLLIYSFFIGIYLGVTYDLLYYFILMHLKKSIKYLCDILFFTCQGFIVFRVIYNINQGIVPFYCYLFFGVGFLIYYQYSSQYYENSIMPLKKASYKIIRKLMNVFQYLFIKPFIDTYEFFYKIFSPIFKKIKEFSIKFFIKMKKKINFKKKKKKMDNSQNSTEL